MRVRNMRPRLLVIQKKTISSINMTPILLRFFSAVNLDLSDILLAYSIFFFLSFFSSVFLSFFLLEIFGDFRRLFRGYETSIEISWDFHGLLFFPVFYLYHKFVMLPLDSSAVKGHFRILLCSMGRFLLESE